MIVEKIKTLSDDFLSISISILLLKLFIEIMKQNRNYSLDDNKQYEL